MVRSRITELGSVMGVQHIQGGSCIEPCIDAAAAWAAAVLSMCCACLVSLAVVTCAGADVWKHDRVRRHTALHCAAEVGATDAIRLLLARAGTEEHPGNHRT